MDENKKNIDELVEITENLSDKLEEHTVILDRVEKLLEQQFSRTYQIKIFFARVFASALGATVGIAIVVILIKKLVESTDIFPLLNEILKLILENIPQT